MKMIVLTKCCSRRCRIAYSKRKKRYQILGIVGILVVLWYNFRKGENENTTEKSCKSIDVVYTWVNGSDPVFIEMAKKYDNSFDPARFDDKSELRYSLRSLEMYAPWIRHVYIVTNGQIPYWLDLNYQKVTIVPHDILMPDKKNLPTFSSSSIETFLHRIPNLSKQFLYLNDDIFLGQPLYQDDLYTDSQGVRIFQAWLVPDCAEDCPWTYIGDGACDQHCNITQCQFDGGDCSHPSTSSNELIEHSISAELKKNTTFSRTTTTHKPGIRNFPKKRKRFKMNPKFRNSSTFKEVMRTKNLSEPNEIRQVVENFNEMKKFQKNSLRTAKNNAFQTVELPQSPSNYKSTKDIYSASLVYTNMLLNQHYGFKARNVLSHVGFFLDKDIITEMQKKFADEINITTSHRFRSPNDLQFAFIYYTYLMSETSTISIGEIFKEFDTDGSNSWSDREIRTFLTRMYPLPLDWSAVRFFEEVVNNCSRNLPPEEREQDDEEKDEDVHPTLLYERYEGSILPKVTKHLVIHCPLLSEALTSNFGTKPKYKYIVHPKRGAESNFMMLTSNVTEVIDGLDRFRKNMKKFNCINDNLEPQYEHENVLVRHLLEDFYVSFFPKPSKFELNHEYRNRFTTWREYQEWKRSRLGTLVIGYSLTLLSMAIVMKIVYDYKAKFPQHYAHKY